MLQFIMDINDLLAEVTFINKIIKTTKQAGAQANQRNSREQQPT